MGLQTGWGLAGGGVAGRVGSWCHAGLGGGAGWVGGWVDWYGQVCRRVGTSREVRMCRVQGRTEQGRTNELEKT